MAFPATMPASGTEHVEDGVKWYVRNGRWHRFPEVVTTKEGGPELNSPSVSTFSGSSGVTILRPVLEFGAVNGRKPTQLIHVDANCYVNQNRTNIGLRIFRNNRWIDFSQKNVNFRQAYGFTRWFNSGEHHTDWYAVQPFTTQIWLGDAADRDRLLAAHKASILSLDIMYWSATESFMRSTLMMSGGTNATLYTKVKMLVKVNISEIDSLGLTLDGGMFDDGRLSAEWY